MCGISGIIQTHPPINPNVLNQMRDTVAHRGPDGASSWINPDGLVGLGHRRLSFLDLSDNGTQPLCNEDGTIWLTYNGEIYNYQEIKAELKQLGHIFKSNTDSEVIVHGYEAWGIQVLQRLKGMFAFAIWDDTRKELFLARDRFGIKPLYVFQDKNYFLFGSELKVILVHPDVKPQVDETAIFDYLTYRYIPSPKTIWKDIQKLQPAHYVLYKQGNEKIEQVRYWDIPKPNNSTPSVSEAVELFHTGLKKSVQEHLRSDVPIGSFLSGGYDSSALVYYMTQEGYKPNTFSIGFDDWQNSEHQFAEQVAEHLNVPHFNTIVGNEQLSLLETLVYHYDEPIADISIIPTYMVSQLAKKHNKAVFSGEGADELLGGYWWQKDIAKMPNWMYSLMPNKKQWLLKKYAKAMSMGRMTNANFAQYLTKDILKHQPQDAEWFYKKHLHIDRNPLKAFQYLDTRMFMGELVLTKIDRATMAHSLEARVPFLDHELFENIISIPPELFYNSAKTKQLLFENIKNALPQNILNRPKQGFVGPDKYYMNYNWYQKILEKGRLIDADILTEQGLRKMLVERDHWRLWKFTVLEFWWRRWVL
jgi:asparagine synthase (glutamine-hydrolysing)